MIPASPLPELPSALPSGDAPLGASAWRQLARGCGLAAAAIGVSILAGWLVGVPVLRSWLPHQVEAKANTAACLLLLGWALYVAAQPDGLTRSGRALVRGLALVVGAFAAATLAEYVTGRDLGIDQWLVHDAPGAPYTVHAGRTPLPSAASLLGLGVAALLVTGRGRRGAAVGAGACAAVLLLVLLAFLGQLYAIPWLSALGPFTPISMPTGVAFFVLALGFLAVGSPAFTAWAGRHARGAGVALSLALLLALSGGVVRNTAALSRSAEWVAHTHRVLERLGVLQATLQETEAGVPVTDAVDRLCDELVELTRDNPPQLERVRRVRAASDATRLLAPAQREPFDWRGVIASLREAEEALLRERQQQLAASTQRTQATLALGLGLAVALWLGVVLVLRREISRREAGEAALRESEEYLAVTLHSIGDAVLATDPAGRVTLLNPVAERLTGWTHAEARGRPVAEVFRIVREGTREPAPNPVPVVLAEGRPTELAQDTALVARDGVERSIADSAAPIRDRHGRVRGAVLVFRDITEVRRARADLDRFFSLSLDFLCIASPDGYFKRASPGVTAMLGWSVEEFLATPYLELVHPDDRDATVREVERQVRQGAKVLNFENRYRHQDGTYRTISWRSVPDAGTGLMYATARDVSISKAAELSIRLLHEELQRHATQLEAANRELEAFSYSVSHDLRAPLRHVQGYVEMLGRELGDGVSEKARRFMRTIADAGREMGQLIDDLLAFSRMARAEMIATAVDLNAAVDEVRRGLESAARDRAIEWRVAPLPTVHGDPAMLRQVWANLLGNAVKYTRGRAPAVIEVGWAPDGAEGGVACFVRDNGAGFDMRYADKLFGVFQRLHRADEFEGTGIGLANVRRIIARHGGRTWAEGRPGEGATFYFSLPAAGADHSHAP